MPKIALIGAGEHRVQHHAAERHAGHPGLSASEFTLMDLNPRQAQRVEAYIRRIIDRITA